MPKKKVSPKFMDFLTCLIVTGEKGGVGKSHFAKLLLEILMFRDASVALADADTNNRDVEAIYGNVVPTYEARFSEVAGQQHHADVLFQAQEQHLVVNLPANIETAFRHWMIEDEQHLVAQDQGVKVIQFFVSNGGSSSLQLFLDSCAYMGHQVQHVFVRNLFFCSESEWGILETPQLQEALSTYNVPVIDIPRLDPWLRNVIEELRIPFFAAAEGWQDHEIPHWDASKAQRIRKMLRLSHQQIQRGLSECGCFSNS